MRRKTITIPGIGEFIQPDDSRVIYYNRLMDEAEAKGAIGLCNKVNGYKKPSANKKESWNSCEKRAKSFGADKLYLLQSASSYTFSCGCRITLHGEDYILFMNYYGDYIVPTV